MLTSDAQRLGLVKELLAPFASRPSLPEGDHNSGLLASLVED